LSCPSAATKRGVFSSSGLCLERTRPSPGRQRQAATDQRTLPGAGAALKFLDAALEADPEHPLILALKAYCHATRALYGRQNRPLKMPNMLMVLTELEFHIGRHRRVMLDACRPDCQQRMYVGLAVDLTIVATAHLECRHASS
jgi:hypothetical protein